MDKIILAEVPGPGYMLCSSNGIPFWIREKYYKKFFNMDEQKKRKFLIKSGLLNINL